MSNALDPLENYALGLRRSAVAAMYAVDVRNR